MNKFIKWFHFDASLRTKILVSGGTTTVFAILLTQIYSVSVMKRLFQKANELMDGEELEEFARIYKPVVASTVIMSLIFILIAVLVVVYFSGALSKRLTKLSKQADALANDELSSIQIVEAKDEIGQVNNSFSMMADRLNQKVREAIIANSAKNDFLSRMSHDVRTPMNAIRGMVEIMKDNRDDRMITEDCLRKIDVSTNHLLLLIDEVLDMSRLDNGTLVLSSDSFDIGLIIQQAYEVMKEQANDSDIDITLEEDIRNTRVVGSEIYTKRIIVNILNNAIKYNKDGGSVRFAVSEQYIDAQNSNYEFVIEDTGIGMSDEFLNKVFEPFTQQENDARTVYKGSGLGLAICKKLLSLMGGKISVASTLNVGTTVTFSIPLALDEAKGAVEERAEISKNSLEGTRVLVVEDNGLNMEIAKYLLLDKNMQVEEAVNGEIALNMFKESTPFYYDIILMDIMMPVMDGLTATKEIRKLIRQDAPIIPIIALSANAYADDIQLAKDVGMNGHIAKPIDMDILYDMILSHKKLYEARKLEKPYTQLFTGKDLD